MPIGPTEPMSQRLGKSTLPYWGSGGNELDMPSLLASISSGLPKYDPGSAGPCPCATVYSPS